MNRSLMVLAVLLLTGAGCVNGLHSTVELKAEGVSKVQQRPPTVYADSITTENAHQKALALEAEMDYDLQSAAMPTTPAATR